MKKDNLLKFIGVVGIVFLLIVGVMLLFGRSGSISLNTEDDMISVINDVYSNTKIELPSLESRVIDLSNNDSAKSYTGLDDNGDVELIVASEPLMSSQAYSFVMVKFKDGTRIEDVKKKMYDNLNMNKWLCVSADKLFITNYDNTIVYLMSASEWSDVFNSFKDVAGSTGKVLEKNGEVYDLPPEIK